jgi:ATP-binding cassette subfamily B protein
MDNKNTLQMLKENYKVVARLFKYSKDFRASYIAALVINALTIVGFSFIVGFSIQWVTDNAIKRNWPQLEKVLIFAVVAFIINSVLYYLEGYLMMTRVEMMMAKVKNELFDKAIHLSAEYFDSSHSGDLQSRLTNDLALANNAISFTLVNPINFLVLGVANLFFIGITSWKMAVICIILVILVVIFNAVFIKKVQNSSERIQKAIASTTDRYSDIINGIPIIKILRRRLFKLQKLPMHMILLPGNLKDMILR